MKKTRGRELPIPEVLLPALVRLNERPRFKEPCDFVFVSQAGTPINETNIASRRLKAIGEELNMPWLSWQVFRRTHKALLYNFGADYQSHVALAFSY